ncbi:NfeD family protein [Chryseolinea sp. H1M3-3]|jgi:membrane-bound ClpP family serine protease|uniref:NfeD family protein n=1 Tax=Chryseolinea sp. H1M3-3 TaxID=3034144 RepID=UPI0023ED44F5|nr:NfeD family protein [Chryseolinea sp. H1M3-3]
MLMWIIIISLLAIGLGLIIVELVFIPGTTVVGLLGLIFTVVGIVISYRHFGNNIGLYILIGTSVMTLAALFFSFRSGAWARFSHKSSIESKVNEGMLNTLNIGDEGITRSALRPVGTAEFGNQNYEVRTTGAFVDSGTRVKIIHIQSNQIIVHPLT